VTLNGPAKVTPRSAALKTVIDPGRSSSGLTSEILGIEDHDKTADALAGFVAIVACMVFFYWPWQLAWADYARNEIFASAAKRRERTRSPELRFSF
jgi:hypothetical protein